MSSRCRRRCFVDFLSALCAAPFKHFQVQVENSFTEYLSYQRSAQTMWNCFSGFWHIRMRNVRVLYPKTKRDQHELSIELNLNLVKYICTKSLQIIHIHDNKTAPALNLSRKLTARNSRDTLLWWSFILAALKWHIVHNDFMWTFRQKFHYHHQYASKAINGMQFQLII